MVATAERVGKVARIGGWGEVWLIRAMPELKRFFCFALVPYVAMQVAQPGIPGAQLRNSMQEMYPNDQVLNKSDKFRNANGVINLNEDRDDGDHHDYGEEEEDEVVMIMVRRRRINP